MTAAFLGCLTVYTQCSLLKVNEMKATNLSFPDVYYLTFLGLVTHFQNGRPSYLNSLSVEFKLKYGSAKS